MFVTSYPKAPSSTVLYKGAKLLALKFSCGNPCNYTYYADLKNEVVSDGYFCVLAFDSLTTTVAYADSDFVGICPLFTKNKMNCAVVKRPFSPTASLCNAIISLDFIDRHRLSITYLTGADYAEKTDTITFR